MICLPGTDRQYKIFMAKKNKGISWLISFFSTLIGATILFFASVYFENLPGGIREVLLISVSVVMTLFLCFVGKGYLQAAMAQGLHLYALFFFRLARMRIYGYHPVQVFTSKRILAALLVFFSGLFVIICKRLFHRAGKKKRVEKENFEIAFQVASILFLMMYALLLYFLFFLQREANLEGNRRLNLMPLQGAFAVYWPRLLAGDFGNDIFIQFFGNLLILMPLGFYLGVYGRKIPVVWRLLIPVLFAGLVESSQYFFNMGAADVDDFWMNVLGAFIGYLLVVICDLIRKLVTRGKEKSIFPR